MKYCMEKKTLDKLFLCHLQELKNLIPKSAVGTLTSDSNNVIDLIIDAYNVSRSQEPRLKFNLVNSFS